MSDDRLRRSFGLSTSTYVVVASMVGVGILTTSGYTLKDTGSPLVLLGLWLVGGVLAACGALTVAELAAALPQAGGEYVFVRETYGRPWAFLYGWVSFLIGFSAPAAIMAHAAGRYLAGPWLDSSGSDAVFRLLAAAFLVVFSLLHIRGQSLGSRVQDVTTIVKVALLAAVALGGLASGRGSFANLAAESPGSVSWGVLAISLVYVMFSFSGWNAATYLAGEVREPGRTLPRALLLGCGGVTALYLLLNVVYVYALPAAEVAAMPYGRVEPIAAVAVERLFGPRASGPFSVVVGLGLLASVSAMVLTGPRVYYAMACDGLFPAVAARLSVRAGTPAVAIAAQTACSLVLLLTGRFHDILTYAGVGLSLSSFFVVLSVFVLRVRRPDLARPFRVPLYPVPPLLFLACTSWMIVFAFVQQPRWSTISVGSILAGIPVYYGWCYVRARRAAEPAV